MRKSPKQLLVLLRQKFTLHLMQSMLLLFFSRAAVFLTLFSWFLYLRQMINIINPYWRFRPHCSFHSFSPWRFCRSWPSSFEATYSLTHFINATAALSFNTGNWEIPDLGSCRLFASLLSIKNLIMSSMSTMWKIGLRLLFYWFRFCRELWGNLPGLRPPCIYCTVGCYQGMIHLLSAWPSNHI